MKFLSSFKFTNRFKYYFLLIFSLILLNTSNSLYAQLGGNSSDLTHLKSTQVSDNQIKQLISKAKERGMTIRQAMDLAVQNGLSPSEASKILERAEKLAGSNQDLDATKGFNRTNIRVDKMKDKSVLDDEEEDEFDFVHILDEGKIFGSDLFNVDNPYLEPEMNIPTPKNYILGVGDELMIDIWGASNNFYQLVVSFEGTVIIDNIGPIFVQGLTIEEAGKRLTSKLKTLYKGLNQDTFINVSLGQVRSIQVTVMGEVYEPGSYTLSSLSTVFNVLFKSGGITQNGSYRNIEVIRDNKVIQVFDIYDILLNGDQSKNVRLNDQDIIKVNVYKSRVQISGSVKRPAYYEVLEEETLSQVIENAGSFASNAYRKQLLIDRMTDKEKKLISVNQEEYDSFNLKDGDKVTIDEIIDRYTNKIVISGAVWRPGRYELTDGLTLSKLIERADGIKPEAFKTRGIIYRINENHDYYVESFNLNEIFSNPLVNDIKLQYEDSIVIRDIYEMREERDVKLFGEVQEPGEYEYIDNMTLGDLLLEGNGLKMSASEAKIEIYRRVTSQSSHTGRTDKIAESFVFSVSKNLVLEGEARNFTLEPFDQIYVRKKPDYQEQQSVTISGEVLYPGEYVLESRQHRLSELIERAGGLTKEAFIRGVTIERLNENVDYKGIKLEDTRDNVVSLSEENTRYIAVDVVEALKNPGSEHDIFLREGDEISVPQKMQTVAVDGAVLRASEIRYLQGRNLKYYISSSGGYTDVARKRKAYVIYANGEVKSKKSFLFFTVSPKIVPGAEIIVPEKVLQARLTPGERISMLTSMVSMSAVVVTAISTINRSNSNK